MAEEKKKSSIGIWIAVAIVALIVLFFIFRGSDKTIENNGNNNVDVGNPEIESLDVGDNPDMGVDDYNSFPVSQEEIAA